MSKNNSGLWTDSFGGVGAFLSALEKQGVNLAHIAEVRANPVLAQKIAQIIMSAKRERELLKDILNSPCPFYPGKKKKDTHFAFMGIQINLLGLQKQFPEEDQPKFYEYTPKSEYPNQDFEIQEYCEIKQYLLLKEIVPGSRGMSYEKQDKLLPPGYLPPLAVEESLKDMLFYKKYKVYLNQAVYARTRSVTSDCYHVSVGGFDFRGLDIKNRWRGDTGDFRIGLGASWDFNS